MKTALISSVRVAGVHTFGWKWQSEDGTKGCRDTFKYFHDCAEDAKKHGFDARFAGAEPTRTTPARRAPRRAASGESASR